MAILTPEQLNKIQGQIDTARAGVNTLNTQMSGFNQTPAITQPAASGSVLKASDIKPQSQLQINELTGKEPDTSLVFSDLAGMKTGYDLMEKKIAEDQKRIEEGKKQEDSWLNKIIGAKTSEEVAQDTASEIGFSTSEYLTQRKTDIAEMESLQKQYQSLTEQRDQELLGLEQNAGFSKSYLNKELTYAEQKWNLRLSAQAGIINTKAAIMKLKDENYTMANQYINQAVTNATAELKLQYDRYDKLRQDNKDLFDDLGDDYRTVYATSEKKALMDYQTAQNEKTQIGNMMLDYPDAPWTANSMSLSLGEAAQIAAQSQKYQLEKQQQQADIYKSTQGDVLGDLYKTLQIQKLQQEIRATENDLESGVLNDKDMKSLDSSLESKSVRSLSDLKIKAENYKKIIEDEGFAVKGAGKILLENAYADLQIAWKEAANLGALTGPDMSLIQNAIKPVTGFTGVWNKFTAGKNAVIAGIDSALATIDTKGKKQADLLLSRNPKYKSSEYVNQLVDQFYKTITVVSPDGQEGTIPEYQLDDAIEQGYKQK